MSNHPRYEYQFVRLGQNRWRVDRKVLTEYRDVIRSHALDGWRLVTVVTPGTGWFGFTEFLELVFEREVES